MPDHRAGPAGSRWRGWDTLTTRGRVALTLALVIVAGSVVFVVVSTLVGNGPSCTPPKTLETFQGVTLQPKAMEAFRKAESLAGRDIPVVQSYRSCASQALACVRVWRELHLRVTLCR